MTRLDTSSPMKAWIPFETPEGELLILKENGTDNFEPVAEVITEEIDDPAEQKAVARLIAAAPEMWTALVSTNHALKATENFLRTNGWDAKELTDIVAAIDDVLNNVDTGVIPSAKE